MVHFKKTNIEKVKKTITVTCSKKLEPSQKFLVSTLPLPMHISQKPRYEKIEPEQDLYITNPTSFTTHLKSQNNETD